MKARFLEPQPQVKMVEAGGKIYVFICLNEIQEADVYDDSDSTGQMVMFYEYDYNEFCDVAENLDLEDINTNPEEYLNYLPTQEDNQITPERLVQLEQQLTAFSEAIERGINV